MSRPRPPPRATENGGTEHDEHVMDQSPTNPQVDPGIWNNASGNTDSQAAAAAAASTKSREGPLAGGRQITRNRASYSCHSCRRRKVKCDKVCRSVSI